MFKAAIGGLKLHAKLCATRFGVMRDQLRLSGLHAVTVIARATYVSVATMASK